MKVPSCQHQRNNTISRYQVDIRISYEDSKVAIIKMILGAIIKALETYEQIKSLSKAIACFRKIMWKLRALQVQTPN